MGRKWRDDFHEPGESPFKLVDLVRQVSSSRGCRSEHGSDGMEQSGAPGTPDPTEIRLDHRSKISAQPTHGLMLLCFSLCHYSLAIASNSLTLLLLY